MRVLISGGSGFIGGALTELLRRDGHTVAHLVRPGSAAKPGDVRWDPDAATADIAALTGTESVIHLSGAGIADKRWTDERKRELRTSRVATTRVLVDILAQLPQKPRVFVCASAVGYYGNRGDEVLNEWSSYGMDFLGLICRDWEAEAARAELVGIRSVMLRFGVILSERGGALPKIAAPFKLGVGGRLGNGQQWMPWVGFEDVLEVTRTVLTDDRYTGPVNVVSPNPVRNEEFTRALARVLHRPAIFPAAAFALRLMLGEMAGPLLLASTRAKPSRLLQRGYAFRQPDLEPTLQHMLGGN
jgi:uncharacterized protein